MHLVQLESVQLMQWWCHKKNVIQCSLNRHLLDKAIKLVHQDSDLSKKGNPIVRNYFEVMKNSSIGIKNYKCGFNGYVLNATSSLLFQGDMD